MTWGWQGRGLVAATWPQLDTDPGRGAGHWTLGGAARGAAGAQLEVVLELLELTALLLPALVLGQPVA